ncbi:MAG: hypothetical protein WC227_02290 [Patescibacteria group bacterium]|jgi:hypothetical protein
MSEEKGQKSRLTLIIAVLMLIFLLIIFFRFGFVLSFWITLILWLVYWCVKYFLKLSVMISWIILFFIIIFSLLVSINVFPGLKVVKSTSKSTTSATLVKCTSTSSDQPTTIPGYKALMYAQGLNSNSETDTGTRTFSLSALKSKSGGDDIYFNFAKDPEGNIKGVKGMIEVCDSNNMTSRLGTTKDTTATPAGENAWGVIYYMHGGNYPHGTGEYRVDSYANVSGTWVFVGRVTGITITE